MTVELPARSVAVMAKTSFVPGTVSAGTGTPNLKGPALRVSIVVPFSATATDATPTLSDTSTEKLMVAPGTTDAGGATVNASTGGVLSMLRVTVVVAVFPAVSTASPETT